MTPEAEELAMKHEMTHAKQNAILSSYSWCSDHEVRVQCTNRTEVLLRMAGIPEPEVLKWYAVPVKRDTSGFLIVDHEPLLRRAAADEMREFRERLAAGRGFEIRTGPHSKLVISVTAFRDESLPSPNEPEKWRPVRANDTEVYAAAQALAVHRDFATCELPIDPHAAA